MRREISILILIFGWNFVNGGKLLAVQKFGAGYPSFHTIALNDDGKFKIKINDNI